MAVKDYSTTPGNNDTAGSVNFAEGQNPSTVNNSARQVMADIRTWYEDVEFRDWGHTVVYASATTFTIAGTDVTSIYTANRAIRCADSSTLYGKVVSSSFSTDTTVTVSLDSGSLSGSLTAVAVGLDPNNPGLPYVLTKQSMADSTDPTKKVDFDISGATTATATTLDFDHTANRTVTFPDATDTLVGKATTDTLTNKTISLANNTVTGTTSQFNTALSDGSFSTLAGTETLTNKTIDTANNTLTISPSDFGQDIKYKTADTSRASTTTLADDDHLAGWSLDVGGYYIMEGYIGLYSSSTTPDIKLQFVLDQTPLTLLATFSSVNASGIADSDTHADGTQAILQVSSSTSGALIKGYIRANAVTASTLDLQWAQNTSDATAVSVLQGSWIKVTKIS